jgi:hypothetical protein
MGCTAGVRFPAGSTEFPLLHSVQTVSEVHPASYLRVKGPRREADHSYQSSSVVNNCFAIPPLPLTRSWSAAWLIKQRHNFLPLLHTLCLRPVRSQQDGHWIWLSETRTVTWVGQTVRHSLPFHSAAATSVPLLLAVLLLTSLYAQPRSYV